MDIERNRRERDGNMWIGSEREREKQEREGGLNRLMESKTEKREREKRERVYIKRLWDGNRWKRWIASERVRERLRDRRTERKRWKQMDR